MLKTTTIAVILVYVVTTLCGCASSVHVRSVVGKGTHARLQQVHFLAVRAFPGDVDALWVEGGSRVGTLRAEGEGILNVLEALAHAASCRGASHFVVTYMEHALHSMYYAVEASVYSVPTGRIGALRTALRPTTVLMNERCGGRSR